MIHDFRYALRSLRKHPGFIAVAVLILGLGIGANTTIFTLVNALLLRTPPLVRAPGELVRLNRANERTVSGSLSYPDYRFYREHNSVFNGLAAYAGDAVSVMTRIGASRFQSTAMLVSANYFDVLGVDALVGRTFLPLEEAELGTGAVAVVSHTFWRRWLGARTDAAGTVVDVNGQPFTVVGVAPEGFRGVSPAEDPPALWVPLTMQPVVLPTGGNMLDRVEGDVQVWLQAIGRRRAGIGLAAVRANVLALVERLEQEFPQWNEGQSAAVTEHFDYRPAVRQRLVHLLRLLWAAVVIVLLIACANVAIMLLARGSARRKELGVRLAIGAGRERIVRQLMVESVVLAALGTALGLALTVWSADAAAALLPGSYAVDFRPDASVLVFTATLSLVTVLLFGLVPAVHGSRPQIVDELKGTAAHPHRRSFVRSGLVVTQVALSIVLVIGAGLFVRSFDRAQRLDLGFDPARRLVVTTNLDAVGYTEDRGRAFVRDVLDRMARLSAIRSATAANRIPFRGVWTGGVQAEGVEPPPGQSAFETGLNVVGPGYFRTMGIPLRSGQEFSLSDDDGAPGVVIVNEVLARQLWGDQDPIGRFVSRGDNVRFRVIGVAPTVRYYDLGEEPQPQMYLPLLQYYRPNVSFVLETAAAPLALAGEIERDLRGLEPDLIISSVSSLARIVGDETSGYRVMATLITLFGALALALAAAGLYGVQSFLVVQRTRELGIRVALGARRGQVAAVVLRHGVTLAAIGIVIGTTTAWFGARLVQGLLFGIRPRDPATFAIVPIVLVAVALLASLLPARRAGGVDPMEALRWE